jgi:UDP-N-acetyl-D-galactosamine dehydrogenase
MTLQDLMKKVEARNATICVVGVGYVGLPLAVEFAKEGFNVIGFDISQKKVDELNGGQDPTKESDESGMRQMIAKKKLTFTTNPQKIKESDFVIIAVPTPVTKDNKPDLVPVEKASESVGRNLRKGSLVVTESSVYPGVTEEVMIPILEKESGLVAGKDFYVGYSPERVNPGDREHGLRGVVKIVSGLDAETTKVVGALYSKVADAGVCEAKDIKTAEAAKIIENIQRDLNIALVNEFALLFKKMGIDVNEVLKMAATKWNFHNYRPGLVGGHCIPVDPYYLVYKSEMVGHEPRIILAGRNVNNYMPVYVSELVVKALNRNDKVTKNAKILLLGLTFKKNVPDIRNSPSKVLIRKLKEYGANIVGYDPLVENEVMEKEYGIRVSGDIYSEKDIDCVVLVTDHDVFSGIDLSRLRFRGKPVMIDVRSQFDRKKAEALGFDYETL